MPKTNETLENTLKKMANEGLIRFRSENNPYLKVSYKGADGLITSKWNIKIYNTGSFVCTDTSCIKDYLHGNLKEPDESLQLIQIDDAGIGFPLGGCMVGASDGQKVVTDVVDKEFFKQGRFESKQYLQEYAIKGYGLLSREFGVTPETHRIDICTGFINKRLKDMLKFQGYNVRLTEIKGMLQDKLEGLFKKYTLNITCGVDLYYDPKECSKAEIAKYYYRAVAWAKKHDPDLLKTGWKSLKGS